MSNFTPLQKPGSKSKKFNKFLVTGNLLLAVLIAVIGFSYYNNILLTTQQKAAKRDCSGVRDCKARDKEYEESGQADEDRKAKKKEEIEEKRAKEEGKTKADGGCPGGFHRCSINGKAFCADNSDSCQGSAVKLGFETSIGSGVTGTPGGWRCVVGQGKDYPYIKGTQCVEGNSVQNLGNVKVPNCFCGTIQIDNASGGGSYYSECGCNKEEKIALESAPNTPAGTIIPTPTGLPTSIPTATPIPTLTNIPTPTDIFFEITPTNVPTSTVTSTPTNTPTVTPTPAPGTPTATPTEIILAKTSISPTAVAKLLETGVVKSFMYLIPAAIMLIGLIL